MSNNIRITYLDGYDNDYLFVSGDISDIVDSIMFTGEGGFICGRKVNRPHEPFYVSHRHIISVEEYSEKASVTNGVKSVT